MIKTHIDDIQLLPNKDTYEIKKLYLLNIKNIFHFKIKIRYSNLYG